MSLFTLTNPIPKSFDGFGEVVAMAGSRVAVGVPRADSGEFDAGRAYVYELAGGTPAAPLLTLTNSKPTSSDRFGKALAVEGTRVFVGSEFYDQPRFAGGAVFVYDLTSATPAVPVTRLETPSSNSADGFGSSVAAAGSRTVVGAPNAYSGDVYAGSVYVYDLAGAMPNKPMLILSNPAPATSDSFGNSVAISGSRVVVGAYFDDPGVTNSGSAYVYDLASVIPTVPILTLINPSPGSNAYFGSSVAISGSLIVVGAMGADAGATQAGIALGYDLSSATPAAALAVLTSPPPAAGDYFGRSVAIDGTTIVAGSPYEDASTRDRGAAYAFGLLPAVNIVPSTPGLATLSWTPTNSPGFVLQYTDALASSSWVNAPGGAASPVTVAATNAGRFYRLVRP